MGIEAAGLTPPCRYPYRRAKPGGSLLGSAFEVQRMTTNLYRSLLIAANVVWTPLVAANADSANDAVVKFAKEHLGKQVGNGECSSLAAEALKAAGAKSQSDFRDSPGQGDYVWGDSVYVIDKSKGATKDEQKGTGQTILPGDIIQARNVHFERRNGNSFYSQDYGHHTAVVLEVKERGKVLIVLEQNVNNNRSVLKSTYRLNDLRDGWLRIYRPVAQ
jgi:hypothetical protein